MYIIAGVQWFFDNSLQGPAEEDFLGSVSAGVQNVAPQNTAENNIQPVSTENLILELSAGSAISIESNFQGVNKVIFEKNSDAQLPIASLTKLMTAVVVLDNYNLSDTVVVSGTAGSQDPTEQDVEPGDVLPVESFLEIMLVGSSNRSAYALSELIGEEKFVELMNQKAKDIGLKDTFFADPTGLSPDNVSTVNNLVKLTEYILENYSKISDISKIKELYIYKFGNVINTDELLSEFPEIVFSKTGLTAAAKGCLVLVLSNSKNNYYTINVILGSDDRFLEMKKLINWSGKNYNQ